MTRPDVFGAIHLGYVAIETQRFADWRRFGADAIGLHVDELTRDTTRFRLDEHVCRFLLQRGPAEDVTALGWQIDDHETFEIVLARVANAGVRVSEATPEECNLRGVERLWRFPGPKGMATEIFTAPTTSTARLRMLQSGFVTGASGMGHVAITARQPDRIRGYYGRVFDARLSDWVQENIAGARLRIRFLRVNERHHSVAVAGVQGLRIDPIRTAIQHLNTQVESLDDLLAAYERVIAHGFHMQWSVGQHTNDRELSFYCVTPSGFEWELGWNPIVVTPDLEEVWAPKTYDSISIWGHTPIGESVLTRLTQFRYAAASLRGGRSELPVLR
ncbi:MAG TPA: VOC family protein [Tetrasphaera sp.]|uniref:VOC family protein n=1 Tax=Nostocoides sp. TaxID=1917966 RepID=UPI002B676CF3|nr:VOC family protein [Tetrasphaera sp.]HNQ07808.1 VOC family protein [Tetrasphaera sp.]